MTAASHVVCLGDGEQSATPSLLNSSGIAASSVSVDREETRIVENDVSEDQTAVSRGSCKRERSNDTEADTGEDISRRCRQTCEDDDTESDDDIEMDDSGETPADPMNLSPTTETQVTDPHAGSLGTIALAHDTVPLKAALAVDKNHQAVIGDQRIDSSVCTFPPFRAAQSVKIDAALEEKFMPIILKHAPRLRSETRRLGVWEAIVNDSRGRYTNPRSAHHRTAWLCRVARDPTHPNYCQVTPRLRELLQQLWDIWCLDDWSARRPVLPPSAAAVDNTASVRSEALPVGPEMNVPVQEPPIVIEPKDAPVADADSAVVPVQAADETEDVESVALHPEPGAAAREPLSEDVIPNDELLNTDSVPEPTIAQPSGTTTAIPPVEPHDDAHQSSSPTETVSVQISPANEIVDEMLSMETRSTDEEAPLEDMTPNKDELCGLRQELSTVKGQLNELRGELREQREFHHRETMAMAMLEKDRQDRKDEFNAMMGLVTQRTVASTYDVTSVVI